jgi:uncharacterized protein (TIGR02452 family)
VLGAYGCGVFRNDAADVAKFFYTLLVEQGKRYWFDNIVFAIKGKGYNLDRFVNQFKDCVAKSAGGALDV